MLANLKTELEGMNWKQVMDLALASGVPFHTIAKIKRGETSNPQVLTVEALVKSLKSTAHLN